MRALVVDSDPASRGDMVRLLESAGLMVAYVTTYEGARACVNQSPPPLLVLDLILPDGSGVKLLEEIRALNLPVTVAIVSGAPNEVLADSIVLRPDGLFIKPPDIPRFRAWLGRVIQRWQEEAESGAAP
jgi:DNA-binding response OmpR family regulator